MHPALSLRLFLATALYLAPKVVKLFSISLVIARIFPKPLSFASFSGTSNFSHPFTYFFSVARDSIEPVKLQRSPRSRKLRVIIDFRITTRREQMLNSALM